MKLSNLKLYLPFWGISFSLLIDLIIVVTTLIINKQIKGLQSWFNAKIVFAFLVFTFFESIIVLSLGYDYYKFAQQLFLVTIFYSIYIKYGRIIVQNIENAIEKYILFSVTLSLCALVKYFLGYTVGGRACSWSGEPGDLSLLILPAIIYYVDQRKVDTKCLIIVLTFVLASSSASFLALFLTLFILVFDKYKRKVLRMLGYITIFLCMVIPLYMRVADNEEEPSVIKKYSETYKTLKESHTSIEDYELLNASSYAWLTNIEVSLKAPYRLIGTGLGTHYCSYEKIYPDSGYRLYGLNKEDAYSLLIRIFSEFGIIGLAVVYLYLKKNFNSKNTLNIMSLSYIINSFITGGHYAVRGIVLFVVLYYLTSNKKKNGKKETVCVNCNC